jgi:hypothetical protein
MAVRGRQAGGENFRLSGEGGAQILNFVVGYYA